MKDLTLVILATCLLLPTAAMAEKGHAKGHPESPPWESLFAEVSYRRLFIQSLVSAFHMLRHKPHIALQEDEGTALIRGTLRSVETSLHGTP